METGNSVQILPTREFHICKNIRTRLNLTKLFTDDLSLTIFPDFKLIREFVDSYNKIKEVSVFASDLNAIIIIQKCIKYLVTIYRQQYNPTIFKQASKISNNLLSKTRVDKTFVSFLESFPTSDIHNKVVTIKTYLNDKTFETPNSELIIEELLFLWLENQNPAYQTFKDLYNDEILDNYSEYIKIIKELEFISDESPKFGSTNLNLFELLTAPVKIAPNSLQKQLEYIRDNWGFLLGDYLKYILRALDFISEENKIRGIGPGEFHIPNYDGDDEYERFSEDKDWMPNVVMIAKNVYVWMDQLSKEYEQNIYHLDHIPSKELDKLANYGFTALWLIGLWERSPASKEIKRMCGNPEAEASAYSLMGYEIANDIGGWEAFHKLQRRCWQRGIRMASDMVPNHTGIDSRWVIEHPDWFLAIDHSPFPAYTFNGENLSNDERVGIFIEDKYFSRSDAAVVFKRVDFWTGDEKYIYHGNDGTSMPWNDTAQLDYLNPTVREAVIQTILHVARNFPIIRFDAAMTLAKRHLQRLWYPEPGGGSDIPSRAEFGLTKSEFDKLIPNEFWREVVDRVAEEIPDTLLLAEAFWMMESYFVRTLGMHRVYNSAFMNMIKMERNADYRTTIKKTLEFDPEILKRFVNFLNNPDEETAAKQFGKGDKYFGVTLLMATMPGLPMFGHNQIEGFEEKYGMEYRKAYWDEQIDPNFVERHKYDIFPLLHKRYLFSGVSNFLLYDFFTENGSVNENVFAYSNKVGDECVLILYNNSYQSTSGWIKRSAAFKNKFTGELLQVDVADGLNLTNQSNRYLMFRDHKADLEYIRRVTDIFDKGLYSKLSGYQYQIFWEMREVIDNEFGHYGELHDRLDGRGVKSIDEELQLKLKQKIQVLFVAAEVTPFSKAGGLADVAGALPKEIAATGKTTVVLSPYYSIVDDQQIDVVDSGISGKINLGNINYEYRLYRKTDDSGVTFFFIKNDHFYNREGIYTDKNGNGYSDNNLRYFFFQYVLLDLIERGLFIVDLIHCNDHHAALIPWMLKNRKLKIPTLLTIHNAEYQGKFSLAEAETLKNIDFENRDKRRKQFNSLAIGIRHCSALNTVSPNYAKELLKKESFAFGLKRILNNNKSKFSGILNGVDYSIWNPETDKNIPFNYSLKALSGKTKNKKALYKKCDFNYSSGPVIGMISRLVSAKGFNLIINSIDDIVAFGAKLIILGTGNAKIVKSLGKVEEKRPNNVSFHNYFNEEMAHLIEAGVDMYLMPSRFEPCGLNQIYSLRYGTIPIVYKTGGLADTVLNWNGKTGNGFVFSRYTKKALVSTVSKAVELYHDKQIWKKIKSNAMKMDYSWKKSAGKYIDLYAKILKDK